MTEGKVCEVEKSNYTIAFITTPLYRDNRSLDIIVFVCSKMNSLCKHFNIVTTGRTREYLLELTVPYSYNDFKHNLEVNEKFLKKLVLSKEDIEKVDSLIDMIIGDTGQKDPNDAYNAWRRTIRSRLISSEQIPMGLLGMVDIICKVIAERLDAVIHLTDWQDKAGKMDSAVLSREANVHNVPIATNVETAKVLVDLWCEDINNNLNPFEKTEKNKQAIDVTDPLQGITEDKRVLALISHDGKKLDMCKFVVEHAKDILNNYDFILATGTTGSYIKKYLTAVGCGPEAENKVRCCKSGPEGGDLQIAYAVVHGLCQDIIFFQDPAVSHPHDSDIRLLEQAVLTSGVHSRLATNQATAALLIRNK
jgi:methylglyoxal synthase